MYGKVKDRLAGELQEIKDAGLFKNERIITTPQGAEIQTTSGKLVINFCANNYLGLSSHPNTIAAAKNTIDTHGYGMSSVRFICGTQDVHKQLEEKIASFLGIGLGILLALVCRLLVGMTARSRARRASVSSNVMAACASQPAVTALIWGQGEARGGCEAGAS